MDRHGLPRLVIASDVPVDLGGGGSILLHRLFKDYPTDKLLVIQPTSAGRTYHKLTGVAYKELDYTVPKVLRNKLNPLWPAMMGKWIELKEREIIGIFCKFSGEAFLTVPHGFIWLAVAKAAKTLQRPLHLIIHDDWPSLITFRQKGFIQEIVRKICRYQLGNVYKQAVSRLCVSPGMEEKYRYFFGVKGDVLYPTQGEDSPVWVNRIGRADQGNPGIGFCGMIHHDGVMELLAKLSKELNRIGGCLHLFTTLTKEVLIRNGLHGDSIKVHGFVPAVELGDRLATYCHALLLPASFFDRERLDTETLFPSKLADYCSVGLPILCWAPEYSSAHRWFSERNLMEWVSSSNEPASIIGILQDIINDPVKARNHSSLVSSVGASCFQKDKGYSQLEKYLLEKE